MQWITRVPLTLKQAKKLVRATEAEKFVALEREGYSRYEVEAEYGEMQQRWIVIESQARKKASQKKLEKKQQKLEQQAQKELKKILTQEFVCEEDARLAVEKLESQLSHHQIVNLEIREISHYAQPGKPKANAVPSHITYQPRAELIFNQELWHQEELAAGRFILATNILDNSELTAEDCLTYYKRPQANEDGFGFLKDPLFFASSVFLKSPKRIMAVGLIMGLCLMVYKLGQRQLRQSLAHAHDTIDDQKGKPTQNPTLRWIFQCFMSVHYVQVDGESQVVNLTDTRRHILQFLGRKCQHYYLIT